ncbi:LPD23 domain-containing protein, partial [uncultured Campylobacter sp.]|uniref:LPD23 domain-containing protein n=1 Tax=uncultured Campylobacter sp. TaxID=218934 RepID=UPI0028E8FC07
ANSNAHLGSGLVAGTLNSVDEDGNFSPERFAAGFLAGLAGGKAVSTGLRKMTPKLYNKILGAAEKMPQMANGNPRLLGKLYSNGKDVSLNSFAGEKAITANVGKLDQAKAMLEKGADEVEIWQKTGWFKDEIDDKWKFEINPRGGELKPNPPRNTVLYNVLNNEKLYEAYPELQLYKVEVAGEYNPAALKALGSADGGFIPSQKTFIINEKTTDFKSTLYHEIQHAIQEIEGFSPGASSKNGKYWLAGGEVEARNVQKRMNDVSYDGFKNSTSMEFFPYKEEAQLQRMAGDKEYMEYHELSKKFDDYLNDKGDGLSAQEEARLGELYEKIKDRLGFTGDDYKKGYELYLKENAEYQKHPLHTLDAPRSERVNIGRGDLNLSKELEKKYILKDGSINEAAVGKEAEPFIEKEYSLENFKAEFSNGKVDTPIGEVDISSSQFQKLERKGRKKYLGLIKPTLERPVFVVDFEDTTFFFKPFRDKDGVVKFASVIKERDGGLDVISNYPMKNRKFELITREGKVRYVRSSGGLKPIEHSSDGKGIIQQNEEKVHHYRKIEEIKREHPNVEKELDESIAAMSKESFNDSNFKDGLISKFDTKEITTQELGKSVNLSNKQLAVLKNDIKNADFKVINESKIYFDKIGKDGDKKRFFVDIAEDGSLRVDGYSKKDIDSIPVKQSALEELAGTGDAARLKNMSFEVKAAYRNELDPIKKEAILKTAELNKLKKAAQSGDKAAAAKFEEFKAKKLDENGNIKDGLSLC